MNMSKKELGLKAKETIRKISTVLGTYGIPHIFSIQLDERDGHSKEDEGLSTEGCIGVENTCTELVMCRGILSADINGLDGIDDCMLRFIGLAQKKGLVTINRDALEQQGLANAFKAIEERAMQLAAEDAASTKDSNSFSA